MGGHEAVLHADPKELARFRRHVFFDKGFDLQGILERGAHRFLHHDVLARRNAHPQQLNVVKVGGRNDDAINVRGRDQLIVVSEDCGLLWQNRGGLATGSLVSVSNRGYDCILN